VEKYFIDRNGGNRGKNPDNTQPVHQAAISMSKEIKARIMSTEG